MTKLKLVDFNMLDSDTIKKEYTKQEIITCVGDILDTQITLLMSKADDLGVGMSTTGSINPKYFKTHRLLRDSIGLKIWVDEYE